MVAGALETWLAYILSVWHYFLNFYVGINKLHSDRKARSFLNQQETTSGGYMGGNKGKWNQVKRSHGLTGLLVESFSKKKRRNRVRYFICVSRRHVKQLKQDQSWTSPEPYGVLAKRPKAICKANGWPWRASSGRCDVMKLRSWPEAIFLAFGMIGQMTGLVFYLLQPLQRPGVCY